MPRCPKCSVEIRMVRVLTGKGKAKKSSLIPAEFDKVQAVTDLGHILSVNIPHLCQTKGTDNDQRTEVT